MPVGPDEVTVGQRVLGYPPGDTLVVRRAPQPPEVGNLAALGRMPTALTGCLGLIATVALANFLVASTRRRGRDLAVLRVIGLNPARPDPRSW